MLSIDSDFSAELAQIQAESIGWIPLQVGAYLHVSDEAHPRCWWTATKPT